jgi:hypothetical protein
MRALAHEADAQLESARRRQQAIEAGKRHADRMRERRRLEALEAGKIAPGGRTRR